MSIPSGVDIQATTRDYHSTMRLRLRPWVPIALSAFVFAATAQEPPSGPDPREIPIPAINTPMGSLPGVAALPVRKDLPDILVMNDGTKVTNRAQWEKRREEIKR